jgi:hypothetical protein
MDIDFTDEYSGVGGCYVVDPTTGKRTPDRVREIQATEEQTANETAPDEHV